MEKSLSGNQDNFDCICQYNETKYQVNTINMSADWSKYPLLPKPPQLPPWRDTPEREAYWAEVCAIETPAEKKSGCLAALLLRVLKRTGGICRLTNCILFIKVFTCFLDTTIPCSRILTWIIFAPNRPLLTSNISFMIDDNSSLRCSKTVSAGVRYKRL